MCIKYEWLQHSTPYRKENFYKLLRKIIIQMMSQCSKYRNRITCIISFDCITVWDGHCTDNEEGEITISDLELEKPNSWKSLKRELERQNFTTRQCYLRVELRSRSRIMSKRMFLDNHFDH